MDTRFLPNNTHLESPEQFANTDPHLRRLYRQKYIYHSPLIETLPTNEPAILTLGGGRQIGKTTLLKQWMEILLKNGINPQAMCFFSGELIGDYQSLHQLLKEQIASMPINELKIIILDEVTDIDGWDKTVKYLADTGTLENVLLVLTGSDLVLIQEARKRFPGRRGKLAKVGFHHYPLSFPEYLKLKNNVPNEVINKKPLSSESMILLYEEWDAYLMHGGFLTAINDLADNQIINPSTFNIYSDWIRGDILKRKKKEIFLREILTAILKHYTKQISWNNLLKELSIDHTLTITDYIGLLESMDVAFVQSAIIEDKLVPAPKKQKKVIFCDPFIFHSIRSWIDPVKDPFEEQIKPIFSDPSRYAELVEACVISHFRRYYPTYYIKAAGEVDVAYVKEKRMWPIELKWTNQLRPSDLKQINKYKNGCIWAKVRDNGAINNTPVKPLPLALLEMFLL